MTTISFYSAQDTPYGCFSNFSPHGFARDGAYWPTAEHYFQAQKFPGTAHAERIRQARSPMIAKRMGQTRKVRIRADWDTVRDEVMYQAVLAKFSTHAAIRAILLETGDAQLVENAPRDYYWGCGADGSGRNQLGKTFMRVRDELRATTTASTTKGDAS